MKLRSLRFGNMCVYVVSSLLLLTFGVGIRGHGCSNHEIPSFSGQDAVLHCCASCKAGVKYLSVIWYKVGEAPSHDLTGLVKKKLTHPNGTVQRYKGFEREFMFLEDSQSLVLPNVTVQDTGRYRCFFSAPVGHQNQDGEVHLKVYETLNDENDGTYFKLAIPLLLAALVMLYVSNICLRNTLLSLKGNVSEETWQKQPHQIKNIYKIESNGVVSKMLPQEYV